MAVPLPYLASNKNLDVLFSKILSAKVPDKFTHEFLTKTIGLKGTNDRPLITLLRSLGFLDQSSTPTATYKLLKNKDAARGAIAQSIRTAYAPLFEANESANALSADKLKGLVSQVAGTDADMTARISSTFSALVKLADFDIQVVSQEGFGSAAAGSHEDQAQAKAVLGVSGAKSMRPEFHYNIQVHLPSNATEEVYLNIFNALRKAFQ